jgi:hypothetical protein
MPLSDYRIIGMCNRLAVKKLPEEGGCYSDYDPIGIMPG